MAEESLIGERFGHHTTYPLYRMFQRLEIKLLVSGLTRFDKFSMLCPSEVKETCQHFHGF
jgi:hypothetical protein